MAFGSQRRIGVAAPLLRQIGRAFAVADKIELFHCYNCSVKINLEPGKYVVAVSGGVDSVALLSLLSQQRDSQLIVAHFDHGIRADSGQDRIFVAELAKMYSLPFRHAEGNLGAEASEAKARKFRYQFLRQVQQNGGAQAIVTAHHQDDLIETAFINLLRGTGRKGLSSLGSGEQLKRPLLHISKQQIVKYAQDQKLVWREDSTNQSNDYLRNYLRNRILPGLSKDQRRNLVNILDTAGRRNDEIDAMLTNLLAGQQSQKIDRSWFIALPHALSAELLSHWMRSRNLAFDRRTIERLVAGLKTLPPSSRTDISRGWYFIVGKDDIRLEKQ